MKIKFIIKSNRLDENEIHQWIKNKIRQLDKNDTTRLVGGKVDKFDENRAHQLVRINLMNFIF